MADDGPTPQNATHCQKDTKRRWGLPNELLAELCHSVVPRLGIWDDARQCSPRHNANLLTVSAALCAFLRPKFRQRKAVEIEQREKCCQICAQLAWGAYKLGPNGKICIGCKCFFVRCLRDKNFAAGGGAPCSCAGVGRRTADAGPKMCKSCRLSKCEQIGLSKAMMALSDLNNNGGTGNRKRRPTEQTA